MRTLLRAGAIALAASSALLGTAVAAQAAPAAGIRFTVSQLILDPATTGGGHTGQVSITIHNDGTQPFSGGFSITEPIAGTFAGERKGVGICLVTGGGGSNRRTDWCDLEQPLEPGAVAYATVPFSSPAKPQPYAQIAPTNGTVRVDGVTSRFPALFRSTTGSLDNPQPYVQDTTAALSVTATDEVVLTRQEDGTFLGRTPVTIQNGGDAGHVGLGVELTFPSALDFPGTDPGEPCGLGSSNEPGTTLIGCYFDGQLAEAQSRTFDWIFTAPADTPTGPAGTATTTVTLENPHSPQTDNANTATFQITIAD